MFPRVSFFRFFTRDNDFSTRFDQPISRIAEFKVFIDVSDKR